MTVRYINDAVSVIPFPGLKERVSDVAPDPNALDSSLGHPDLLRRWAARAAFRRDLSRLLKASPHLVRDIGLDEALVRREVALPFWRAGRLRLGGLCLPLV